MIRARFSLYDFYSLSAAQCSQYLSYICTDILINHLPPILRCKYYVILAFPFCMGCFLCPFGTPPVLVYLWFADLLLP